MKKLLVFGLIVLMLLLTTFVKNEKNPLFALADRVCLVVEDGALSGDEIVDMGEVDFVYLGGEEAKEAVKKTKVEGLEFYISALTKDEILKLLKATVLSESVVEGMQITYAYSPYYQNSVTLDGKKVNLQIAERDGEIIAGFPLILTGY